MTTLVGVDGCRGGWLALMQQERAPLDVVVAPSIVELIKRVPKESLIGIDIPIGLPEAGPRVCDREARKLLKKPRSNSVFSAPLRACLKSTSYEDACNIRHKIEGKKLSRQAYGILGKVAEVDQLFSTDLYLARRVIEVHPEVSFAQWNAGQALQFAKRKTEGKVERRKLIDSVWPRVIDGLRERIPDADYSLDDLYDAFAALWSIRRYTRERSLVLGKGELDSKGLPMRIVA